MFRILLSNQWKIFLCFAASRLTLFLLFYHFDICRQTFCFHFPIWITAVKCWKVLRARSGTARAPGFLLRAGLGTACAFGILLRAGWGTAFAWGFCSASSVTPTEFILLRLFIRGCATAYPCLRSFAPSGLVYQGLRYRLPLSKVFRPVGACLSGIALPLTPA